MTNLVFNLTITLSLRLKCVGIQCFLVDMSPSRTLKAKVWSLPMKPLLFLAAM